MNSFKYARFKLTLWYLLISMLIGGLFSVVIFTTLSRQLDRAQQMQEYVKQHPMLPQVPPPNMPFPRGSFLEENFGMAKGQLFFTFLIINGIIFIVSGGAGYFLAGRTLHPLQTMMDEQTRFITDASHELKTPLTALRTELEVSILDESMTIKQAKEQFKSYHEEVMGLQGLTEKLLELTYQQKKRSQFKNVEISTVEVMEAAIKKVSPLAKLKHITIQMNIEDYLLHGEQQGMTELFVILLDNAIKYSDSAKEISISSHLTDHHVAISIADQGIGISEKDLPHVFDRFYRVDKSRSKTGGFGLGLSIAKEIVTSHKGTIQIKSELNKGTTFITTFPYIKMV